MVKHVLVFPSIKTKKKQNKKDCKTGWWLIPTFTIELPKKDASILYKIKAYFGVGSLNIRKSNGQLIYTVASVKD